MPRLRAARLRPFVLPLALTAALMAGAGCDEKEEVPPEDQRLFLSAIPSQTCPAIVRSGTTYVLDESAEESLFELVATVFADDGQVQEGVEVMVESNAGQSFSGETDTSGQVRQTFPAPPRTPDRTSVEWTASAENGEQSETTTVTGFFPFLSMSANGATSIGCGEEFQALVSVNFGCLVNAANVSFLLEAQDESGTTQENVVAFVEATKVGALEFDEDIDGTNDMKSTLQSSIDPVDGSIDIAYSRDGDDWGLTGDTGLFLLTFQALEGPNCIPGSALLVFSESDTGQALITPALAIGGTGGQYDLLNPPNDAAAQTGPGILFTLTGEVPAP